MLSENEIAARLKTVQTRIDIAARRSRRDSASVRLVLASKTQSLAAIHAAWQAGARDFGENYVQEALSKRAELADLPDLRWHLIGHLQRNKARLAASAFTLIHTIDSAPLADALARARSSDTSSPPIRGLIEVNLAAEPTKSGVHRDDVESLLDAIRDKVEVVGLMTIPPPSAKPELARAYFALLRELRDRLATLTGLALSDLSMGMSNDFEIAIEEGATIVRVGRAVFGDRQP